MKTLLFLLLPIFVAAQQIALHGVVTVFNSKFETGKTEYVANAQVEESFGRANAATSAADGVFSLVLVGVKEKSSFDFTVKKTNYEVVNSDQLRAVAGQRDAVRIFLAPRGKLAENKRAYYEIGKTASEKALTQKIKAKQAEVRTLRGDQAINQQEISQLEKEIADLNQRYQTIDQSARELSERFSRVNLDDASDLYQRAFRHFQNGFIDSALLVLDEVNWVARVDSILAEEANLFALKNIINYNDSILIHRRDSIAEAINVKIKSHLGLLQHREALRTSEWLLQLYARDAKDWLVESYRQAAWIGVLAQEFSLAKLYAQSGLDLKDEADPMLQRYLAYSLFFSGDTEGCSQLLQQLRAAGAGNFLNRALGELQQMEQAGLSSEKLKGLKELLN